MSKVKNVTESLFEDLKKSERNWTLLNILADHFADEGKADEAASLFWLVEKKKSPYCPTEANCAWFDGDNIVPGLGDQESNLPGEVYKNLKGGKTVAHHMGYEDFQMCFESYMEAWIKAVKEGWNPTTWVEKEEPKEEEKK